MTYAPGMSLQDLPRIAYRTPTESGDCCVGHPLTLQRSEKAAPSLDMSLTIQALGSRENSKR
jgi:hypothetical protein